MQKILQMFERLEPALMDDLVLDKPKSPSSESKEDTFSEQKPKKVSMVVVQDMDPLEIVDSPMKKVHRQKSQNSKAYSNCSSSSNDEEYL